MNRRKFLKAALYTTAGGLILPSAFLSSCRKKTLFEKTNYDGKVLIIGSGIAGLYAGYILNSKGINFQILEAAPAYGGRLGNILGFADFPLDSGAQWLHGRNSIMGDLVVKSQTKITLDDSAEYYWYNNQVVPSLPVDVNALYMTEDLPDVSYKDLQPIKGLGAEYNNIVEGVAGDSGAAASRLSSYWKIKEEETWQSGDDDYKFQDTYYDLIDSQIASQVKNNILLNTIVTKIDYNSDTLVITDSNNHSYTADKVIITVPITMLKNNSIQFSPPLPSEKTTAFSKIGMDAGIKVYLKFSSKFYNQNIIGGSICASYADETIGKTGNDNVLMAFIMGTQAEYLTSLGSDAAIVSALLQELDSMYSGKATASYISSYVKNWGTDPFIQGAYSYSTVGMGNARTVAAQPVNNKLFFAGEAMNINGNHQSVHGAAETGYREVINILNGVKK